MASYQRVAALAAAVVFLGAGASAIHPPADDVFYACAKDEKVLPGSMTVNTSADCDGGGKALVTWNQAGPAGPQGPAGPPGADGTVIYGTYAQATLDDVPAGTTRETTGVYVITAHCAAGDLVTGGGFQGIDDAVAVASFQVGNTWETRWENHHATDDNIRAYATCLDLTP